MCRSRQSGFTLIELMVVLAVAGVLASIALPAYDNMMQRNRVVTSVNDFLSTLHMARSEAITRNARIGICRSNAARSGCETTSGDWANGAMVWVDSDGDRVLDAAEQVLLVGEPVRGQLTMSSDEFTHALTFYPSGRIRASAGESYGEFRLCQAGTDDAVRMIIIERTGRPRSSTTALDGDPGDCA